MASKVPAEDSTSLPPYTSQPRLTTELDSAGLPSVSNSNVLIIHKVDYGRESQRVVCPHCQADVSTRISTIANSKTHIVSLLMCHTGLCCCIPCVYCTDSCLETKHYCPGCKRYLGHHGN